MYMGASLSKINVPTIPGQGILEKDAGEENCVKDREAPGGNHDHNHNQPGDNQIIKVVNAGERVLEQVCKTRLEFHILLVECPHAQNIS